MNYNLNEKTEYKKKSTLKTIKILWSLIRSERKSVYLALGSNIIQSSLTLLGPLIIGYAITNYVETHDLGGLTVASLVLLATYVLAFVFQYFQVSVMGRVGQRVLYSIRARVFKKIQDLPVSFFQQNKTGDLISRINNDTDKLNQFFSQVLMRFIGNIFVIIGAAIFILAINFKLGLVTLLPAVVVILITNLVSPWIQKRSKELLESTGALSTEIDQGLESFKAIIISNRRDYFAENLNEINKNNYRIAKKSAIATASLNPLFDTASNLANLILLIFGLYLVASGELLIGFFVSYISYINKFYDPLREISNLWATFQTSLAAWDRISEILVLQSDMKHSRSERVGSTDKLLEMQNVSFSYSGSEKVVLHDVNIELERGKTYAFVGPTGGGKTTTASIVARLFDPTFGTVFLSGRDIKSYSDKERSEKIGFILQEPFLFAGSLYENILYGNEKYQDISDTDFLNLLEQKGVGKLMERLPDDIHAKVTNDEVGMSLGQKQIIAFLRAVLREPDILILDEATANIDTVTENLLEDILQLLPEHTTLIIIAHRLNTISNADVIYFVNSGTLTKAGSVTEAIDLLKSRERGS